MGWVRAKAKPSAAKLSSCLTLEGQFGLFPDTLFAKNQLSERIDGLSPRHPPGRAVLHQRHTSYSLYAGQDVVEVLTKCRVQRLWRGDVRFVDVRRY
ncbi:MAG: hypothetical protein CR217_03520 [Beijerinckiaceae bacterium]|nr:MAG: hypothetical protein CR217_03520 [Beijerinckiaceae bacterium]